MCAIFSDQLSQASFPSQSYGRKYQSLSPALAFRTDQILLSEGQCELRTQHGFVHQPPDWVLCS